MTTLLAQYGSIETALFVKIVVPDYSTLLFSDYNRSVTINGDEYLGLGQMVAITDSQSELRASDNQLTITMVGIQNNDIPGIMDAKVKGSRVEVRRAFFDATTGNMLAISPNPTGRFFGIVNNYSLEEDFPIGGITTSNTLLFVCTSVVEIMNNKYSGRRTNPIDQKSLYPTDRSMDRVPNLANSNFNFGSPV